MKKHLFFIMAMLCMSYSLYAQQTAISVSGMVQTSNGQPLAGVILTLQRSQTNTITDAEGNFFITLSVPRDTLIVSHIGYQVQRIAVSHNNTAPLIIQMQVATEHLQGITVSTGYQQIPKERATGSFEEIDNQLFNRAIAPDIISRLEGVSSIYFDKRLGQQHINIHGQSTIYANTMPLIVVNNFPYNGDINNINPNDVESITLLKDAAAASIWGVRAANGVIVITTKRGGYNKPPKIEFNTNVTIGEKPDLFYASQISSSDFINVEQFLFQNGFYDGIINNTYTYPVLTPVVSILLKERNGVISSSEAEAQINILRNKDVRNDLGKYFYQGNIHQQYAMNYSAGSKNLAYFLSGGFDKDLSDLKGNSSNRITFRSENTFSPVPGLKLNLNVTYSQTNNYLNNTLPAINPTGKFIYPYAELADDRGHPLYLPKDYRTSFTDTAGNGKLLDWGYSPLEEQKLANNKSIQTDAMLDFNTAYKFNDHLNVALYYSLEKESINTKNLFSQNTYFTRNLINLFSQINGSNIVYGIPLGGITDLSNSELLAQNARGQINYQQSWNNKHDISIIGGAELRQSHTISNGNRTYGYDNNILTYGNVNYAGYLPTFDGIGFSQKIPNPQFFNDGLLRFISLYGNGSYTYNERYTFSLSMRKDASNLFGVNSNQKWVPLWSTGISWEIDKENFYKPGWLPFLKLRITYGYNGNVDNTLSALTTISYASNAYMTGLRFANILNPPNPQLRWEKTGVLNIGMDFSSRNERLSGSLDFYQKNGKDLIGQSPVDPTTGVVSGTGTFSFKGNVADLSARGIDLSLNSNNLMGEFKWSTHLILNYAVNKVTKYHLSDSSGSSYIKNGTLVNPIVGKPLYTIYSYKWAGLDPNTGDPQGYVNGKVSEDYSNIIGQTKLNDLVYDGPALPPLFGSIRNTFSYKNISLSVNILYSFGYYFRRSSINYSDLFNSWVGNGDFAKRWQKPGDEKHTNVPSMIYPDNSNRDAFYSGSSVLVDKGDNIRLKDISLSYKITRFRSKKIFFNSIRIYAYLNNIGIIWKANHDNLDPDYFSGGYPIPRTAALGVNLSF